MLTALRRLPALSAPPNSPLPPRRTCVSTPLWGDPLFHLPHTEFDLLSRSRIDTVFSLGQAFVCALTTPPASWPNIHAFLFGPLDTHFASQGVTIYTLTRLIEKLPPSWLWACRWSLLPLTHHGVVTTLSTRLGWSIEDNHTPLSKYTVRLGTQILVHAADLDQERLAEFRIFCAAALGVDTAHEAAQAAACTLPYVLQRLWKLRWDNKHKEVLWRLIYNGLPTAARLHQTEARCTCGHTASPDRAHHYWDCPIALAVISTITAQLPMGTTVVRSHIWLCTPPTTSCNPDVWGVVCLCALGAMDHARRQLYLRTKEAAPTHTPPPDLTVHLGNRAVAHFGHY